MTIGTLHDAITKEQEAMIGQHRGVVDKNCKDDVEDDDEFELSESEDNDDDDDEEEGNDDETEDDESSSDNGSDNDDEEGDHAHDQQFILLSPYSLAIRKNARRLLLLSSPKPSSTVSLRQQSAHEPQQKPVQPMERSHQLPTSSSTVTTATKKGFAPVPTTQQREMRPRRRTPLANIADENYNIINTDEKCSNTKNRTNDVVINNIINDKTANHNRRQQQHRNEGDIATEIESDIREIKDGIHSIASMAVTAGESVYNCALANLEEWTDRTWNVLGL